MKNSFFAMLISIITNVFAQGNSLKISPTEIEEFRKLNIDVQEVKKASEVKVIQYGGKICDWLPYYEITSMRSREEIINRALIMNAMISIYFQAPISVISNYIKENNLQPFLSNAEQSILNQTQETLSEQDRINLYWYIESLWALLWVMNKSHTIDLATPIPDTMILLCPDLQKSEGTEKFTVNTQIRGFHELYIERDLYYRAMWFAREISLRNETHPNFSLSLIIERRRALDWCLDKSTDWDNMPQDT